ncbi:hypothetical protein ACFL0C_00560 [Patescibacteria group bacterium]
MKKKGLTLLVSTGIAALFTLAIPVFVWIDLVFNPWIKTTQMKWWNFFTTEHYLSWLVYRNLPGSLIVIAVFWLVSTVLLYIYFTRD